VSLTFLADRGDARLRLDLAVVRRLAHVPRISRARVQRWIGEGLVLVNDRPARRASSPVAAGDVVNVRAPEALVERVVPGPESLPLDILHEDADLIVLNKPAGLVVHPTYKHASGTILNALLGYLGTGLDDAPRLVHRLDKDTSGVLLVSRSLGAHVGLQRALASRASHKEYLTVVRGTPRPRVGTIQLALGRDVADRRRVVTRQDGRESETRYEVLARSGTMSLVRCELITGRTHQIRVHLGARGWPIVGDSTYGIVSDLVARQALHAWRLSFPHPISGEALQFTAPLPEDLRELLASAGLELPPTRDP
jgi:23S rRNA pseudouridine1911/1915/1917 synthase